MDIAVITVFIILMGISVVQGISMVFPLLAGLLLFSLAALRRGYGPGAVAGFIKDSLKESFIVVGILLIIGCLTGMWRLSGTVAYFVTAGVGSIPPRLFILAAFLLASFMSFAIGTSFGVSATAGVILMSIARAGGVNTVFAAGAVLSGIYVGDRGSPAASSANLVAVLTRTDMRINVREMFKSSAVPYIICAAVFGILSLVSPMENVDTEILSMLGAEFRLHWMCILPAVIMIVLPFMKVRIRLSMMLSLAASVAVAMVCQGASLTDCLTAMISGYSAKNAALRGMISGGGVVSMLEVGIILIVSCSYGRIFEGTGMLTPVNRKLSGLSSRYGRFPVAAASGIVLSAVFCNQTIGAIMQSSITDGMYTEDEKYEKMIDIENSVILLSTLVPWCIACSVPVTMIGADLRSLPFNLYSWLVPLYWLIRRASGVRITVCE